MSHNRLNRQEIKHDEFVSGVAKAAIWIEDNRRLVMALGGGIVAVLVLGVAGQSWWASRQEKALTLLSEVERRHHASVQGEQDPVQQYSRNAPSYATREEKFAAVVQAADDLLATYGSGPAARQARYYRALAERELGKLDEATVELEKLLGGRLDPFQRTLARVALAEMYEATGRPADAAKLYEALASDAPAEFPREMGLLGLGRCLEREQKPEEARAVYRRIVEEFGDSPYASEARTRLRFLG